MLSEPVSDAVSDLRQDLADQQKRAECLQSELTTLAGHVNALEYRFIKLLDEFDAADGWHGEGIKSLAHWLNWQCGLGSLVAREKVRVARALRMLPSIDAAFASGAVSYSKVRAMTRVATPQNEALLLQVARHGTAQHVEQLVRKYKRCQALDTENVLTQQGVSWYQDDDGLVHIHATLTADDGALVVKAIETLTVKRMAESLEEPVSDPKHVSDPKNVSAETFSSEPKKEDELPIESDRNRDIAAQRAMTLVQMSQTAISTETSGDSGASGNPYHVLVHLNANATTPDYRINGGICCHTDETLSAGQNWALSRQSVRRLTCDGSVTNVIEDDQGNIRSIGRRSRVVPRAMGIALRQRDQGCRFPNCHQRKWTDAHHIRHWCDGGETSLNNLVTLCRHHHTALHKGEYRITVRGDEIAFVNPSNQIIHRALERPLPAGVSAADIQRKVYQDHRQLGLNINQQTAVTGWLGEDMDYGQAITALFGCDKDVP